MASSYKSNIRNVERTLIAASDKGLEAAAQVVINEVKRRLRGGYTSGKYVTGRGINSVTKTEPYAAGGRGSLGGALRAIRIGSNLKYHLYWEVGFQQRLWVWFSKKMNRWVSRPGPTRFMRKEIWRPALLDTRMQSAQAYARVFKRFAGV